MKKLGKNWGQAPIFHWDCPKQGLSPFLCKIGACPQFSSCSKADMKCSKMDIFWAKSRIVPWIAFGMYLALYDSIQAGGLACLRII